MLAFVASSGIASSRFDLVTCHGDPRDHVVREVRSRGADLVVLAFKQGRVQQRITRRLLEETRCDLVTVNSERPPVAWLDPAGLVACGPWTS